MTIDLSVIIQGVSIVVIGGGIVGYSRMTNRLTNELTRLATIITGMEKRLEHLEQR